MAPHIAVVGAGPLGLMATKNFLECGFDVTCYESRPYVGGLWNYSDDASLSVAESTVFNSSRYRSAISDYPFDNETDDFPTWRQMWRYLDGYTDKFQLRKHIELNCKVERISRVGKKWKVEVHTKDGKVFSKEFDKVAVAVGTFHTPKYAELPGVENFEGMKVHSLHFNGVQESFHGKRVLCIGIHASTQDVVMALKKQGASQVYASHKNGLHILPRYAPNGSPFDVTMSVPFVLVSMFLTTYFPALFNYILDSLLASMSKKAFPNIPASWKFTPVPSVATTNPLIADELYPLLASGFCNPVASVSRITGPKTVELTDGTILEDIDAIVYCTGYIQSTPAVDKEYNPYPVVGAPSTLYRGTFSTHPDAEVRDSIVFLGHGHVAFPGFVQHELISMAVGQVWLGNSALPPLAEMKKWQRGWMEWREKLLRKQKTESTFYVGTMPLEDHLRWFDEAAGTDIWSHFGIFSRKAWSFWWNDRELYRECARLVFSPALWRFFETGKRKTWDGARKQIYLDNEQAEAATRRRLEIVKSAESKKTR
ncbi:hypothetical protein N0V93_004717 [Gnomoniopsis smithogilvyi]|uniref:Uncharacterized protein n=1 Tax=Gnomoniopsis smithogilvyi TaxID=1191159 RepID=A0A9W8YRJ7_9PEZI|nr:hypothetical protein N0V93_004717 [Gnomoniopsis smithogilvyi]